MAISKHVLKRLRRWSTYQNELTIFDAHQFLTAGVLTNFDYNSIKNINNCAKEMRDFLVSICEFEKTPKIKKIDGRDHVVFRNRNPVVGSAKAARNYIALMTDTYNR